MDGRATVLGGGGSAGQAWMIGVVAGLAENGVDVTDADLVIGTSAGATVAAQITSGTPPSELLAGILDAPAPRPTPPSREAVARRPSVSDHLERTDRIIAASTDPADLRRRMGAAALETEAASDDAPRSQARRRALVAERLPGHRWPDRRLVVVAVDARTGEPVLLDRDSGVDLVDAVAASTAGPGAPPHPVGDARYVDGGFRSTVNADLAVGYDRVLVLAPFGERSRRPPEWGVHLSAQLDALRSRGSRVEAIVPDQGALAAFGGGHMMDPAARPASARAGHAQGSALADRLVGFWR